MLSSANWEQQDIKEMALDTVVSKFLQRWTTFAATKHLLSPPPTPLPILGSRWGGGITTVGPVMVAQNHGCASVYHDPRLRIRVAVALGWSLAAYFRIQC